MSPASRRLEHSRQRMRRYLDREEGRHASAPPMERRRRLQAFAAVALVVAACGVLRATRRRAGPPAAGTLGQTWGWLQVPGAVATLLVQAGALLAWWRGERGWPWAPTKASGQAAQPAAPSTSAAKQK